MSSSVVQLNRTLPSGWSLGMFLVPLGPGQLLVHSPTWLGSATFEKVEAHGQPSILFAPNHYHYLSLPRYREQYPEAAVVASPGATPRLRSKGQKDLQSTEAVDLPEGFRFLRAEGVKTGEAFLSIPGADGRTWIVGDAFHNVPGPIRGMQGFLLKILHTAPGLSVGTTFWWLGLRHAKTYLDWLERTLADEQPTRILFSHGAPLEGEDLPDRLFQLAKKRLS